MKKRWKILLTLLALCALLFPFIPPLVEASSIRRHPQPLQVGNLFDSILPYELPASVLVLKRGAPVYDHDVRAWIYRPGAVRNTFWNRWLMQRDAVNLRANELHLLARYPLPPDAVLLPKIQQALLAGEWATISLLRRIEGPGADEAFRQWADQGLQGPASTEAFLKSLPYIVGWKSAPLTSLLNRFWPQLSEIERSLALAKVAYFMGEASVPPDDLLTFLEQALERRDIEADGFPLALIGHFLARPATRERALRLLRREAPRVELHAVENAVNGLPPGSGWNHDDLSGEKIMKEPPRPLSAARTLENALLIFHQLANEYPSLSAEALHAIAHQDIRRAEEVAAPILNGADSELRKSAIVILIRHGSEIGPRFLDEAFKGATPRRISFGSIPEYLYGSRAAEEYVRIARHDYQEVGKSWPPAASDPLQWEEEVYLWPAFISQFPWFPGSDDAAYRLAFAHHTVGDPEGAIETVLDYFQRFGEYHPDGDAEPYLRFLVRMVGYGAPEEIQSEPLLAHLRTLLAYPPGLFLLDDSPDLGRTLEALAWFRAHKTELNVLGASSENLAYLDRLIEIARLPSGPRRLRQAIRLVNEEEALAPEVLYGRFAWLEEVKRSEPAYEFVHTSMQQAADRLSQQLLATTAAGEVGLCLALLDWLSMHQNEFKGYGYDDTFEGKVFDPLFAQVEQARAASALCTRLPETGQ